MEVITEHFSPQPAEPPCSQQKAESSQAMAAPSLKVQAKHDPFHVMYKVPIADTPYGRAKHLQLVDKDHEGAIALFREAILAGDRVDSALKDMAVVMKQQDRASEAIHAIESFRDRCSDQSQESLDNILMDLYKKCGMIDEQIDLLKHKLMLIQQGTAFNGKPTKTARSHGKKFQLSIKQETIRLLRNLGWAYMQQTNYAAAEIVYRKAQSIDPDENKPYNLSECLMKQGKLHEAAALLQGLLSSGERNPKLGDQAMELLKEISAREDPRPGELSSGVATGDWEESLEWCRRRGGSERARRRHRLRVFEQMTSAALPQQAFAF